MADMPPWLSIIEKSVKANKSLAYARYVQLATIRPDGRPANRTVVFRGFLKESSDLTFITDLRSNKVAELSANPAAEVAWYLPQTREQFRLSGNLQVVGAEHPQPAMAAARQAAWNALSPGARTQFGWPQPGLPRDPDPAVFSPEVPGEGEEPSPAFGLLILHVHKVDYLQLFKNERVTYSVEDDWQPHRVNP
ncbi:hypothetical protein QJQ45_029562 [Haematococcus lacustris]|nr:hypothetical protein QJQ45_029562 [Haematococcus lacustris]